MQLAVGYFLKQKTVCFKSTQQLSSRKAEGNQQMTDNSASSVGHGDQ